MASCKLAGCFGEVLELGFCGAELAPHRNQLHRLLQDSGGGVLLEKLSGDVRPTSQNPYPLYDQNLRFLLPYLWPDQKFDSLFMTVAADTVSLNMRYEGLLLKVLLIMMKK